MRFTSPYRRYGVVIKPAKKIEIDGELVFKPGVHIQFEMGQATVDDPDVIKQLIASKWYGKDFIAPQYEADKQSKKVQEKSPEKITDKVSKESNVVFEKNKKSKKGK